MGPMRKQRQLAILGATGSIGRSAIQVAESLADVDVWCISGHHNLAALCELAHRCRPKFVIAANEELARRHNFPADLPGELLIGEQHLDWAAAHPEVDVVLAAIVGSAGLPSAYAAVAAGKRVALANKESLVMAGHLLMPLAIQAGAELIPVDSEHSAILQANLAGRRSEVQRVVITASGGPFRDWSAAAMQMATPEQALNHPTWSMGSKISIDSATMMNKSLEVIEAGWLFDLRADQISVMVHPQSIIHSLVEFVDGSVLAQLSPPDMKLPIQYALTFPERLSGPAAKLDWSRAWALELYPPDVTRFPALELGFEVIRSGGTSGAVLNGANEAAVAAFMRREILFPEIAQACRDVLHQHKIESHPSLAQLVSADLWAREEIAKWILS